jgi:O-antigen ligase
LAPHLIAAADPATLDALPTSWKQRLEMTHYVVQRIAEQPLFGWGLDASRTFQAPMTVDGVTSTAVMLHPHNIALQIWLELGGVGAALAALAVLALGVQIGVAKRDDRVGGAAAAASLAAFFCLGFFSFGLWQEWYGALGFAAAGLAAAAGRVRRLEPVTQQQGVRRASSFLEM